MITICPQCQLPLAVTAADLRTAQGQVRCGRCAAVFNALASLYEPGNAMVERRGNPSAATASPTGRETAGAGGADGATPSVAPADASLTQTYPGLQEAFLADSTGAPEVKGASDLVGGSANRGVFAAAADAPDRPDLPDMPAVPPQVPSAPQAPAGAPVATTADAPPTASATAAGDLGAQRDQGAGRDWEIDTMTAAELAALVARANRDEPAELASIQIAIDEASEITVLPSESPAALRGTRPVPRPMSETAAQVRESNLELPPVVKEALQDRRRTPGVPRLAAAASENSQVARARDLAATQPRSPRGAASLRWLELEPAQPATGSLAATLGLQAEADFGARTGVGVGVATNAKDEAFAPRAGEPGELRLEPGFTPFRGPFAATLDAAPEVAPDMAPAAVADDPALEIAATGAQARTTPLPRWMWPATLLLGVGLVAQFVHLYREELAGMPALQEPIMRLYAALGSPVAPRWEVGRYDVRQQGVEAAPAAAGTLTVRASIRNGAARAQPAPLLRVMLQDRFGNRIAVRDLTPREYGGAAASAPAPMLAPGQRIDAEVSLLDPGGEAVGFELDVCLRRADASIVCANDAPPAAGG